jgi:predicted NBD/HSP70 family sugar kinase
MYLGVNVSSTHISLGFVGENGNVSHPSSFPVDPEMDGETILLDLIYSIKTMAETVPVNLFNNSLDAVGVTIQGEIDEYSGIVLECVNCGLERINLKLRLQKSFEIPINVNTDANAIKLAQAEITAHPRQNPSVIAAGLICKYAPNADESV